MKHESGFTLLETLVALVLMSLLLVALFGAFRAGIASWRLADEYVEKTEPQLMLAQMLHRHMSQLKIAGTWQVSFRKPVWDSDRQGVFFLAESDALQYIAPLGQAVDNQLFLIELRSQAKGQPGLWIKMVPYDEKRQDQMLAELEAAQAEQISQDIEVKFSYLTGMGWQSGLKEGAQPTLLRVDWFSAGRTWASTTYRIGGN